MEQRKMLSACNNQAVVYSVDMKTTFEVTG